MRFCGRGWREKKSLLMDGDGGMHRDRMGIQVHSVRCTAWLSLRIAARSFGFFWGITLCLEIEVNRTNDHVVAIRRHRITVRALAFGKS
ncbi:hypothetical protein EJ03DRAFT_143752, partial [Teratosphaeria nubilosa]